MATFGVYPCEDAPARAVRAAAASAMAIERPALAGSGRATVRLAVHACEVSVRRTTTSFAMDVEPWRQAQGAVNAILTSAEAGAVLVSPAAAGRLRGRFKMEPAAMAAGEAGPVFRLASADGPDRGTGRLPLTPFVGRQLEVDMLERAFDWMQMGRGQIVGIVGEPGSGKSRLLEEFSQRLTRKQAAHRRLRFLPQGYGLADLTMAEVLRQVWRIAEDDGRDATLVKVRRGLERFGIDADRWAPYLLALFGVQVDGVRPDTAGRAEEVKLQVFDGLRRVAAGAARREPLVIEVEDLHAFGKTARECLAYLVENIATARILVLATYEPQYHPAWAGRSYVTQLSLAPLTRSESLAIVGTILPPGPSVERLGEAILTKAEGNPLFLEELARSAAMAGEDEIDVSVPDGLRNLVDARLADLEDEARRLLRAASAVGRRVPARLLERVCEEPARFAQAMGACKRRELLHEEIVDGEPGYVFRDTLVWEVVHQSLSPAERRALRRAVGLTDVVGAPMAPGPDEVALAAQERATPTAMPPAKAPGGGFSPGSSSAA
jgi:energy-coupling factor transporter ATP-binding protein EcfA2